MGRVGDLGHPTRMGQIAKRAPLNRGTLFECLRLSRSAYSKTSNTLLITIAANTKRSEKITMFALSDNSFALAAK